MKYLLFFFLFYSQLFSNDLENISFEKDIKPILDKRCVVCHSCYNSPCQLKLSSLEGLLRGASKTAIYENRIEAIKPSRLFVDEITEEGWREDGFYSVIKKDSNIMLELLKEKQRNPNNEGNYSPENNKLICSKDLNELDEYIKKKPYHGMPYGFPALNKKENELLQKWLNGKIEYKKTKDKNQSKQLQLFEEFLNNQDIKHQVTARYIYEHLFLAHIKFDDSNNFYTLERVYDVFGKYPVKTRVPYGKPNRDFYYKFKKIDSTIVHKTHMVYKLNLKKLKRYKELFIKPKWNETPYLVSYDYKIASNPLLAFEQIPLKSRYQFLLDNVHYFVMTFIRGPVCKGQIALNVINDQFWIAFKSPDYDYTILEKDFIKNNAKNLSLPTEYGGDSGILDIFNIYKYNNDTIEYYQNKNRLYKRFDNKLDMQTIWRGNSFGEKDNDAILTVYRHFDSASVHKGALGDIPKTMWVIDYPLLERLYYSLVVGFDVFGNTNHKLLVRKYMDRLRIEGESNFLEYLPKERREKIFNSWYKGTLAKYLVTYTPSDNQSKLKLDYKDLVMNFLNYTRTPTDSINFIGKSKIDKEQTILEYKIKTDIDQALREIGSHNSIKEFKSFSSNNFNLIYIRFKMEKEDLVYSIVINRWHDSVAFMFDEDERLDSSKDTINFINGFVGSYPNFFAVVEQKDIPEFFYLLHNNIDETKLAKFFINRNDKHFWEVYDWFQDKFNSLEPIEAGLFDLNRYYKKAM